LRRARSTLAGRPCGWVEGLFLETAPYPAAAAVAGYLLLRLGALDRLWNWPGNLPDQMRWMPDVAVIHAGRLIRQEQGSPSPSPVRQEQARERLLHAVERGSPSSTTCGSPIS
jgi:hypothetical protein